MTLIPPGMALDLTHIDSIPDPFDRAVAALEWIDRAAGDLEGDEWHVSPEDRLALDAVGQAVGIASAALTQIREAQEATAR